MKIKTKKVRAGELRCATRTVLSVLTLGMALLPTLHAQVQTFSSSGGFGPVAGPLPLLNSLKTAVNPVFPKNPTNGQVTLRKDLVEYIADSSAAIQLGKAFFWDMQAGSDSKTACASCHFHAGADRRDKNQINPGPNGKFDSTSPNGTMTAGQFPFTTSTTDRDDIAGSQGVRACSFQSISSTGAEITAVVGDSVFNVNGVNLRAVTGKNAPSVINAVFNHRQFHNGRAQSEFNGVNPFGYRDLSARVWQFTPKGGLATVDIKIPNASLASQAVGPALNTTEMSSADRTFPDLGRKLLLNKPLGLQKVDPKDSVLGPLADTKTGKGLNVSYAALLQKAFQPKWWNSQTNKVRLDSKNTDDLEEKWDKSTSRYHHIHLRKAGDYAMFEANFSLFWGLSIMLYEATLVSDDSPIDQYFDSDRSSTAPLEAAAKRISADLPGVTALDILQGLAIAELPANPPSTSPTPMDFGGGAGCIACHAGPETTSASIAHITIPRDLADAALKSAGFDMRMERMLLEFPPVPLGSDQITFDPTTHKVSVTSIDGSPVSQPLPAPVGTYDTGWYNLGVRPTTEDPGLDGQDPFGNYLSWTRLFQALPDPTFIAVPGSLLGTTAAGNLNFPGTVLNAAGFPFLSGSLLSKEPVDVAGTFKVASLRNVELTGPYFHNGGKSTLLQVVDFYNEGGEFPNPTKHPNIRPLMLSAVQENNLVAFLMALTDERVRWQKAPFDHPQLFVPNGDTSPGTDNLVEIPAVGAGGASTPIPRFLNLNPFQP
jgi:cytochrome c peroxidase